MGWMSLVERRDQSGQRSLGRISVGFSVPRVPRRTYSDGGKWFSSLNKGLMAFFMSGVIDRGPSNVTAKPCPLNGRPKAEQAGVHLREVGHQDPQPQARVFRVPED